MGLNQIGDMFKPKKKKSNKYGWLPPEINEEIEEAPIPIKQNVNKSKVCSNDIDYVSLVAEWNCFKYKMEAFIAQQKRK